MDKTFGGFSLGAAQDMNEGLAAEQRVLEDIKRLGLVHNAWELDVKGWTVLQPEQVGPRSFIDKLREGVFAAANRRHQVIPDLETGLGGTNEHLTHAHGAGINMPGMLFESPAFEQALMHERMLALITYLIGESCNLSSMVGVLKTQGPEHLELHADLVGCPSPFPPYAQTANATWLLSDYSRENGCTCFVDGSHLKCRAPSAGEATELSRFKPVKAPAGSILIWGSNTWHGALPRTSPGLRASLLCFFARWYYYKAEPNLTANVTEEMIARNPRRFRRLTGVDSVLLMRQGADDFTVGRAAQSQLA